MSRYFWRVVNLRTNEIIRSSYRTWRVLQHAKRSAMAYMRDYGGFDDYMIEICDVFDPRFIVRFEYPSVEGWHLTRGLDIDDLGEEEVLKLRFMVCRMLMKD